MANTLELTEVCALLERDRSRRHIARALGIDREMVRRYARLVAAAVGRLAAGRPATAYRQNQP